MFSTVPKRPGKVAVFVGSHRLQGHELREIGFRSYFRDNAPSFEVLDTLVNLGKRQITYETTLDLMHGNLSSSAPVWSAGPGGHQALREVGKGQDLVAIVNEIMPESRSGPEIVAMAVATPLRQLCQELIRLMARAISTGIAATPGQTFCRSISSTGDMKLMEFYHERRVSFRE
ncbi:hypothetical protein J1C56_23060 [Aminobacter anthyllidis]|uniref:Uncharacterized protein n=1 Tax=Aminobacter anthyllidis TaxID=1035067 RepID=A0A9X1AEP4_9HYPH|nr:hypothetical protein [Aminobacter anthyllidis]MBT1158480.1 hypothetical protein [Aminobacter anthyllidis]